MWSRKLDTIKTSRSITDPTCHLLFYNNIKFPDDRGMIVKPYTQKNDFWAPYGDRTCNLLMTGETLQPLSYQDSDGEPRCKFDIYVQPKWKPLYIDNDRWSFRCWKYESLEISSDERGMIIKPYTQKNDFWAPEGCGFNPCQGLRNHFSEYRTGWSFLYHLKIFPSSQYIQHIKHQVSWRGTNVSGLWQDNYLEEILKFRLITRPFKAFK